MMALARWAIWPAAVALALLAGCASQPKGRQAPDPATGPWSGRLALQVKDQPNQSFAAMFELKGSASTGELTLSTPFGNTLAVVAWAPGTATLRSHGQERQAPSLDELVAQATGSALPVTALFDWLRGMNSPVRGWRADLSQLAQGRLAAVRMEPPPEADLQLVLDQ